MNFDKVLIAVDFSDESQVAVAQGTTIARRHGAALTLAYVGEAADSEAHVPADMFPAASESDDTSDTMAAYLRVVDEYVASERQLLDQLAVQISDTGIKAESMLLDGPPARSLIDAGAESSADLIVTGTHGRTGLKRFFLGSVAERVVRHSECAVLVARAREDRSADMRRILVATDFSESAEQALAAALSVATDDAEIDILHCWYMAPLSYPYYAPTRSVEDLAISLRKSIAGDARKRGEALIAKYQKTGCKLRFHTVEAPPSQGIQDWLEQNPYDLVVTGSHSRTGAARLLLGSVAEMTVRHAPCSVLVVHGQTS